MGNDKKLQDVSEVVKSRKPENVRCGKCNGSGKTNNQTCPNCGGSGSIKMI